MELIKFEDNLYPVRLKEIKDAPKKLYVEGDINNLNNQCVAIVGSRKCTEYGKKWCKVFVKELVKYGITIVSGMAIGIDTIAHDNGLIISEYYEEEVATSDKFLERNRIVSGLTIAVLVVEAAYRSGTSVTAKFAKEQNRDVFCIPRKSW